MARRHTQVAAVAAVLIAVVGGAYAARELVRSDAGVSNTIICPRNAPGWSGRVTGPRPRVQAPLREKRIVSGINAFRRANGLRTLVVNRTLADAARAHSGDMLSRGYFDHDAPGGTFTQRMSRYTPASCIAENIAWGTGPYGTGSGIVEAWKRSPGHRRVMLLPYVRQVGVGVRVGRFQGASGASVATADFSG